MSIYDKKILNIRMKLFLMRFKNELNDMDNNDDLIVDSDRKKTLNNILNKYKEIEKGKDAGNQLKSYLDTISKNMYKKKWNLLTKFHKSIKLKAYANSLTKKTKLQERIYSKLINALNDKKIHTTKSVLYDVENETILNIKGFTYNKDTEKCEYSFK
jgi:hypothetical protein